MARSWSASVCRLNSQYSASGMKTDTITTAMTCRKMIQAKIDLKRIALFALGNQVADAAHGMNFNLGAPLRELFAEAMDVDLDGIRGDFAGESKNMILDQLFRDHMPAAPHQQLEPGGLAGRQNLGPVVDICLAAFGVEREVGDVKRAAEQLAGPPHERFQPRQQLLERKRLDQIIVGTAAQPAHP